MTKQITEAILRRALEQERRGDPRPPRSMLRQILAKLGTKGALLVIVPRERVR